MRENVASHSPWRLSFDGCAPWFPGVARIHTSDTHTIRFHRWNLNEADEAFVDFIIDLPLKYLRKIIEWGGFQPSIANTCFQERLTEYNLLAEYSNSVSERSSQFKPRLLRFCIRRSLLCLEIWSLITGKTCHLARYFPLIND
jgi:hypothetical protein